MEHGRLAFGGITVALVLLGASAAALTPATSAAGPGESNVLVILTDDQRADTMEVMPSTREFFTSGTNFNSAWVTTPQCCPSRASFLSGKYAHNHGVLSNADAGEFDSLESWPRVLDQAGYQTGYFGKYLNGTDPFEPVPNFDQSFLGFDRKHSKSDVDSSAFATRKAMKHIESAESKEKPWATVLALRAPHSPRIYPKAYENTKLPPWRRNPATRERDFEDKNPDLAAAQKPDTQHGTIRAGQLRMLAAADDALAELYRMLEDGGTLDDTLVIFTSDNGYYWGEHGLTGKALPYLDSHHVPLFVRGSDFGSSVSDELVANIDLAPTILDVAGLEADYPIDGESLLSEADRPWLLLEGPTRVANDDAPVWRRGYLSPSTHYFEWRDGFDEYYDLESDPFELENLLVAGPPFPDDLTTIRADLRAASSCVGEGCP